LPIQVPKLPYARIKQYASGFLEKYHPGEKIPIPIEQIIDVKLGINIIPIPGLIDFHVEAYTWSDLKNIVVDKFFYDKQPRRYRFTLAHELGHIVLHSEILKSAKVNSIDAYLDFVNSITDDERRWTEWQADCFAGLVLVPVRPLELKLREAQRMAASEGLPPGDLIARGYMADWISDFFEVSRQVIETRLVYESFWSKIECGKGA